MLLQCLLVFVSIVIAKKKKDRNISECFLTADSSAIKCRKLKKIPRIDFCSSTSRCYSSSDCSSSSSSKCRQKKHRGDRENDNEVITVQKKYRSCVDIVDSLLSCQSFDAKFLIGQKSQDIQTLLSSSFVSLLAGIDKVIDTAETNLIARIKAASANDEAELESVFTAIHDANQAFYSIAETAILSSTIKADEQIIALAKETDERIIAEVKDTKSGLLCLVNSDFGCIAKIIETEYPIIQKNEENAIYAAFAVTDDSNAVLTEVYASFTLMTAAIDALIANAKTTLLNGVGASFRELELSLDLLFCETSHKITDVVKECCGDKKIEVTPRYECNPPTTGQLMSNGNRDELVLQVY